MDSEPRTKESHALGYLCVDRFLANPIVVSALHHCWIRGWIDRWILDGVIRFDDRPPNAPVLEAVLKDAQIAKTQHESLVLTEDFKRAWSYADLMTTKLEFCREIFSDIEAFGLWLENPEGFQGHSKLFGMFDYSRCIEIEPGNIQSAARWVKLTTVLSRYEASLFFETIPWEEHRSWLDLGGNSGEFAMQVCRRFSDLHATVLDLPVVCYLGKKHVDSFGMSDRVGFQASHFFGDFPQDLAENRMDGQYDLVSFKSVLHDWPDEHVLELIKKAWGKLTPGGRFVVIERAKFSGSTVPLGLGQAPVWMFWNYYRAPAFYESIFQKHFQVSAQTQIVHADMTWMVMQVVKPLTQKGEFK
jgi:SAM-dependent methyltransferase